MSCAVASALADMVTPQIIRVAVDQVIGSAGTEGPSPRARGCWRLPVLACGRLGDMENAPAGQRRDGAWGPPAR